MSNPEVTFNDEDISVDLDTDYHPVVRFLLAIRSSFLLFLTTVGIIVTVLGLTVMSGAMAGMFVIWGTSAVVYAGIGYAILWAIGYI